MDFNKLKQFDWEALKRVELGIGYAPTFLEIQGLLSRIKQLILEFEFVHKSFTQTDINRLKSLVNQTVGFVEKTRSFDTQAGERVEQTKSRATSLLQETKIFYESATLILSEFQMYLKDENRAMVEKGINNFISKFQEASNASQGVLNAKIGEFNQKLSELNQGISQVHDIKEEVEELNDAVKDFSLSGAVSGYGDVFLAQARINKNLAWFFGGLFVLLILGSIFVLIFWFLPLVKEINQPSNIADWEYYIFAFLIRFSVLFLLYLMIREVLKNYNANLHMYHLNTHRNNSLLSFDILVKNNKLPENRDAIVKEIAQTIFAHQENGYLVTNPKKISLTEIASLISAVKK